MKPYANEAEFRRQVIHNLEAVSGVGHVSHVESPDTSAGIPDIDYCLGPGVEGHIELKFGIEGFRPTKFRPTQFNWFRRRCEAGGNPWLLASWNTGGVALAHGRYIKELHQADKETWLIMAYAWWEGPRMEKQEWHELYHHLSVVALAERGIVEPCPLEQLQPSPGASRISPGQVDLKRVQHAPSSEVKSKIRIRRASAFPGSEDSAQ